MTGKSNMPLDLLDEERDVNSPADSIDAFGGCAINRKPVCAVLSTGRGLHRLAVVVDSPCLELPLRPSPRRQRAFLPESHTPWR